MKSNRREFHFFSSTIGREIKGVTIWYIAQNKETQLWGRGNLY